MPPVMPRICPKLPIPANPVLSYVRLVVVQGMFQYIYYVKQYMINRYPEYNPYFNKYKLSTGYIQVIYRLYTDYLLVIAETDRGLTPDNPGGDV